MRTDAICDTIRNLKGHGYYVAVKVVAVNEKSSKLGIVQRYEGLKERIGYGRWTSLESHDAAYDGMMKTLQKMEHEKLFDSLMIYDQAGNLLYENNVINNELENKSQAVQVMEAERNREWTLMQTISHLHTLVDVIEKMEKRNAEPEDIVATILNQAEAINENT